MIVRIEDEFGGKFEMFFHPKIDIMKAVNYASCKAIDGEFVDKNNINFISVKPVDFVVLECGDLCT